MSVADENEILEYLSDVMRDKEMKPSESFKAAELLGKYYGLFSEKKHTNEVGDVIIIDDIPETNPEKTVSENF